MASAAGAACPRSSCPRGHPHTLTLRVPWYSQKKTSKLGWKWINMQSTWRSIEGFRSQSKSVWARVLHGLTHLTQTQVSKESTLYLLFFLVNNFSLERRINDLKFSPLHQKGWSKMAINQGGISHLQAHPSIILLDENPINNHEISPWISHISPLPSGVINNMGNPHQKSSKCVCFEKIIELNLNDEFSGTSAFTKAQCHGSGEPWSPASTASTVHGGIWWPMGVGSWWVWIKITGVFIFWYWNHT